jgi:hypothetical protein
MYYLVESIHPPLSDFPVINNDQATKVDSFKTQTGRLEEVN